jgi:hypothetical protein
MHSNRTSLLLLATFALAAVTIAAQQVGNPGDTELHKPVPQVGAATMAR